MEATFIQLAAILGISCVFGFIVRRFNLPLIIAYLFGGLLIASIKLFDVHTSQALSFLPDIGIAFVLFLVGMELDLREVKNIGRPILAAGLTQIFITTLAGYSLAQLFGFGNADSWYLGVGLSFSSTIVVVKLLVDKKDLTSLYGKLSLGILLLEDLVAVFILLALTSGSSFLHIGFSQSLPLITLGVKILILFGVVVLINRLFLPTIFKAVSDSGELLFLTALAWCFIYVSFSILLGFSVVIGAFLAGVALAASPYHFQIQGKVKPLRDFFTTLFFVYLGTQVNFSEISLVIVPILIFTVYALIIKPTIFLLILGSFGFRKHTMFQSAINLSQVSEFSLIIALVGFRLGVISPTVLTMIALSGVLSIILSSLMISNSSYIYRVLISFISFFERKNHPYFLEKGDGKQMGEHVVVIGAHRVGGEIVRFLKREKVPMLVLDFNPKLVETLEKEDIHVIYGDMGDPEILDTLGLSDAKLIISTAQDLNDTKLLLEELKERHINVPAIVRAETANDAKKLYKAGADFVIIPEVLAGDFLVEKLRQHLADGFFKDRSKVELDRLIKKTLAWE